MAEVVIMPKQGQSVESCIITELKKKTGDAVKKGDVLFTYETDKASFEEVSSVDGILLACLYQEGDEVPVLENMMVIGIPGEVITTLLVDTNKKDQQTKDEQAISGKSDHDSVENMVPDIKQIAGVTTSHLTDDLFISPRARKLIEKESVDYTRLAGTGPQGRIIERDVVSHLQERPRMTPLAKRLAAQEGKQPQSAGTGLAGAARSSDLAALLNDGHSLDYEDRNISNIRKLIARSMHASLQNSAQLTHHLGADARRILELRKKVKAAQEKGTLSVNITLNDMVCFAVIKALKKFPNVNTHFLGEKTRYFHKVHLGLAVDTDRGLMVPVVRNADDLSITGLAAQLKEIAAACRNGCVNPDILSSEAGSFTVSNLGNYGVEMFTPVINLPQSAILGVNTIIPRPKDLGDGVYAFVPYIGLSLTYDHRSLDGGEATRFLKQIAIEIETLEIDVLI